MAELGKAFVQIIPSAKGIKGSIEKSLGGEAESAGLSVGKKMGLAMVSGIAVAGIGKAIGASVREGGALEQSLGGVETLFKDNANKVKQYASQAYRTAGLSGNEYMQNVTSFSASLLQSLGGDTSKAADVANMAMVDMSDNANKMGTSMQSIQDAYQGFAKQNYTMLDNLKLGYGGTKTEMERLLSDAEKLTGVKYDINNLSDVYEAIHAVQTELGVTGTTALEANQTISGSFNAMKAAYKDLLGNMALGQNVAQSMNNLASTISTFLFGNLVPMIGTIMKSLPEALGAFFTSAIPLFAQGGANMLSGLASAFTTGLPIFLTNLQAFLANILIWVQTSLPMLLQAGMQWVQGLASGFGQGLPQIISQLGQILAQLLQVIIIALPQIISAGIQMIVSLGQGILQAAPGIIVSLAGVIVQLLGAIISNLPQFLGQGIAIIGQIIAGVGSMLGAAVAAIIGVITGLIGALVGAMADFLAKGAELIASVISGITSKTGEAVGAVVAIIGAKLQAFSSKMGEFLAKGSEIINSVAQGIQGAAGNVINAALSAAQGALDAVSGFVGSFFSIGSNIVQGMADGIRAGVGSVIEAARSAAQQALSAAKSALGIHSPSRVFRDSVGKFIPEGMALGIGLVKNAVDQMNLSATSGLDNDLAMSVSKAASANINHSLGETENKKPLVINMTMGNHSFKKFVSDITDIQNAEIDFDLAY